MSSNRSNSLQQILLVVVTTLCLVLTYMVHDLHEDVEKMEELVKTAADKSDLTINKLDDVEASINEAKAAGDSASGK